jgi:hypothetical protein
MKNISNFNEISYVFGGFMADRTKQQTARHPLYHTWANMKNRCSNKNHRNYNIYGGRGIRVCERWMTFILFAEDMGPKPSAKHSLDRIDSNGNYEPSNCRWADPVTQGQNTSRVQKIEINGVVKCFAEWCRHYNIHKATAKARIKAGASIEKAVTTPVKLDGRASEWRKRWRKPP